MISHLTNQLQSYKYPRILQSRDFLIFKSQARKRSMGNSKSLYSKEQFLYYYIERNDQGSIHTLLEKNPQIINKPLTKDSKQTALMRAAYNGNLALVELLAQHKANINEINKKGQTALTTAVKRNHIAVCKFLIDHGADVKFRADTGLSVVEYAILPGYYEIASMIYEKLEQTDRQLREPQAYAALAKKYAYRYVNYKMLIQGLITKKYSEEMPNFLKKEKVKLIDPVVDPRETWKQWFKRTMEFKDAPMVERSVLPQNLQPQNRTLGKAHHYTHNFMSTPLSQKSVLYPTTKKEITSEMGDLNSKKPVSGVNQFDEDQHEVQSAI